MDTSGLLNAVINSSLSLKKLYLSMPEQNGYQGWLEAMRNGDFLKLEQFIYRLPDRWLGEQDKQYHARVEKALQALHTAVIKDQLPSLGVFIVENNEAVQMYANQEAPPLPDHIWTKVAEIEEAILVKQTQETTTHPLTALEQALAISASSTSHTLESEQLV